MYDDDGIEHRYYTDAFIPSQNRIVETKSILQKTKQSSKQR